MKKSSKNKSSVIDLIRAMKLVRTNRFQYTVKVAAVEMATNFIEWDPYAGAFIEKIDSSPMNTYNVIIADKRRGVEVFRGNLDKNLYSRINMLFNLSFYTGKSRL